MAGTAIDYARGDMVFAQGDQCDSVMYVENGGVKLSVISETGREAVVALLGHGDFFGEGCLAGQPIRTGTATAITGSTILSIDKRHMMSLLHRQSAFSDRFIAHMLARNIRIEEDLIDQLFNSGEKRLARALLLLARYGKQDTPQRVVAKVSQEALAEMSGTTRARVNVFMNRFKKLGFIDYAGTGSSNPTIRKSLLHVVLDD
jgi:CRP/FNR family cyclic AMP-dependent transcriptional regulator